MTYQITYFSPEGHAQKLADALRALLPPDTPMEAWRKETAADAEVQLVGYELGIADLHKLPQDISAYLRSLTGKTVFLFATIPFRPSEVQLRSLHRSVAAELPMECDYRGLYVCAAEPPEMLLEGFRHVVERHPENSRARHWKEQCEQAVGHPNAAHLEEGCRFARHVLKLNP